jgi:hypothetical protein
MRDECRHTRTVAALDAPDFERYGEEFDSHTGIGRLEIWVRIKA